MKSDTWPMDPNCPARREEKLRSKPVSQNTDDGSWGAKCGTKRLEEKLGITDEEKTDDLVVPEWP